MRIAENAMAVLAAAFILMSFPGCAEKEDQTRPPISLTVEPLVGIGDVKFGDSKDVIISSFGEPDQIQGQGNELTYVASKGMSFTLDTSLGLQRIKLWSDNWPQQLPYKVSTFTGKTKDDVGMGASREQIVAAYGQSNKTSTSDSPSLKDIIENLHYDKLGAKFTLAHGNLVGIILEAGK